jgi:rhamnogalacturonan endolyase
MRYKGFLSCVFLGLCLLAMPAHGQRIMERLGRGFVAVGGGTGTLLSWRLYGTEQGTDVAFNVYKGGTKLNAAPITTSTNYQDTATGGTDYTLKAIIGGVEEATGTTAMALPNGYLEIPLQAATGRKIHLAYVGDLDGDGEYEYVVDRFGNNVSQYVDAYRRDGKFMWRVDMGPNSTNTDLSLSGPDTLSCGHADNEAVFDIDSDGKGEVILRGGNGMIFGDGKTLNASTTQTDSFIVAIDGVTGAEKGKECAVPQDLKSTGNVTGHFSSAYWDGVHPSLYFKGKAGGTRAMMDMGFDFKDDAWSMRFKVVRTPMSSFPNDHQVRCVDLDADGIDECVNGGYAIKGDGTVFWNMGSQGIGHGDRWHIGDMDPNRPGLEGWGIAQGESYDTYYYDAKTGTVLKKLGDGSGDINRGTCGDVDPTSPGYECWTAMNGIYNVDGSKNLKPGNGAAGTAVDSYDPAVNFRIWWDGDVLSENLDGNIITKYAYPGMPAGGFSKVTLEGIYGARNAAPLYGDMFGDWREEVLLEKSDSSAFRVYTTAIPTEKRIYTLVHDPEYRNSMNEKGYIQSHMLDYYLGDGMTDPPKPNITYPPGGGTGGTAGTGGVSGSGGATGAGGAGSGGTVASGGTPSTGGAVATGGRGGAIVVGGAGGGAGAAGGRGGSSAGTGGAGGTAIVGSGGTSALGGGPGTGGAAGGNPATGGSTVVNTGGTVVAGTGGTTAVVPATGGTTGSGAGGSAGGQSSTGGTTAAASSGCSCAIGATSRGFSAVSPVAMLGALFVFLKRRRRRTV